MIRAPRLGVTGLSAPADVSPNRALEWSIEEAARLQVDVLGAGGTAPFDRPYWRELRSMATERGLEIEPYVRSPFDLVGADPATAREALLESIDASRELGGPVLRTGYGNQRVDRTRWGPTDRKDHLKFLESNLREAATLAEAQGVVLAIENHTDFTGPEWARIFARVGSQHIQCALDTGNTITIFCDPDEDTALAPWTVTTHIKDVGVVENPRPATGPSPRVPFGLTGCPIGEGNIDIPRIVRVLFEESPLRDRVALIVEPSWPRVARGEKIAEKRTEMLQANLRNLRAILRDLGMEHPKPAEGNADLASAPIDPI